MIRALWTAASGMRAEQFKVDTIANNLSNVNTTGFKRSRAEFQDLFYVQLRPPGSVSSLGTQVPSGLEVGLGVRVAAAHKLFGQGNLQQTDNPLDLAIEGRGFFQIRLPDGSIAYTRNGSFKLDADGRLVNSDGYELEWDGKEVPKEAVEIFVASDGTVSALMQGDNKPERLGTINLVSFPNPAGLVSIGGGLWKATSASGDPIEGRPGRDGMGKILQGFLEMSNVQVVDEMVDLIAAQRAYELNSKAIQSADEMMALANNLRR